MLEIRIHGRGGQGVVTMAELLAKSAMKTGLQVQTVPFFGVERRGAAVKVAVRFDQKPIKVRSLSNKADVIVLLDENLLSIALSEGTAESFIVVYNGIKELSCACTQWRVDAVSIAVSNQLMGAGDPFINVPIVGALCRVLNIPITALEEVLHEEWGKKASANITAARSAYDSVEMVKEV